MMYDLKFYATDDADWAQAVELINEDTNGPLTEAETASFALEVKDGDCAVLSASTDAGTITRPDNNVVQWRFTASQMSGLCAGQTYKVGCTMTTTEGTVQLFIGSLALVDGGF